MQTYYQMNSVEQLEQAWLPHLRDTKGGGAAHAGAATRSRRAGRTLDGRLVVRQTVPPAQPQLDPAGPVARGQSDDETAAAATLTSRPAYLPEPPPVAPLRVPPPIPPAPMLPPVRLGVPEFGPARTPGTAAPPSPTVGQGN